MNNNCNLTTCRYNADGKCTNEEKRKECVRVSKAVLIIDDLVDIEVPDNQWVKKKNNCNLTTCRYNADGKCTNEEKRKECVEVSRKVLCLDENI